MLHRNLGIGGNHPTHNWEYANAAARVAATGFVAGDLKKLALQLDDYTLWILTATTPTWQQFGAPGASYTDEQAQDAIGTVLVDSDTIDFTYTDATPAISATARVQQSITSDASGLRLSGDAASPGANKVYGTDSSGIKGWKNDPAGGGGGQASIQFQDESGNLGSSGTVDTIDFTGAGVTATRVGNKVTIAIAATGGAAFGLTALYNTDTLELLASISTILTEITYI